MECSRFSKSKVGRCKRNLIPWHCQKRYLESLNQISLNNTMVKVGYKRTISKLQANNKILALALQQSRCIRPEKDELVVDNGKLMDIINFSKLKLIDMSTSMKKATSCLDETLLMLNSCISNILSKPTQNNVNYRNDFKSKIQEINIEPIDEAMEVISENASSLDEEAPKKSKTKGNKLSVRQHTSTDNRKRKSDIRQNCKISAKIYKPDSTNTKSLSVIKPQSTDLKNSKECVSVGKRKRAPLKKNFDIQSNSSSTHSETSYKEKDTVEKSHEKNRRNVFDAINGICETLIDQRVQISQAMSVCEQGSATVANGIVELSKDFINIPSKDICLKIKPSDEIIREIESLPSFSSPNDVTTKDNSKMQTCPENKNIRACILNRQKHVPSSCTITPQKKINDEIVDLSHAQPNVAPHASSKDNFPHSSRNNTAKSFKSPGPTTMKKKNKVHFYIDTENAIEKWSNPKPELKQSTKKNKMEKVFSNLKKNASSRKRALQPITVLPNNKKRQDENHFVVTAEVHRPPDESYGGSSGESSFVQKMQPSVVLTDILKSYKNDISLTVGSGLLENELLREEATRKFPAILIDTVSENDLSATDLDSNSNSENRILPRKSMLEERKEQRRRQKVVSYKEPALNMKMRRCL